MNPDQPQTDSESIPIYYTLSCAILQDVMEKNSENFEKNAKKQDEIRNFRILLPKIVQKLLFSQRRDAQKTA